MAQTWYPAVIEAVDGGFSVFFPDLPGCVSAGKTIHETALNAEQALSAHLVEMAREGDPIPEASALDAVVRDPDVTEVTRLIVKADLPGRSVRLNITLDEGLVAAIDRVARNRSGFLAEAARDRLSRHEFA